MSNTNEVGNSTQETAFFFLPELSFLGHVWLSRKKRSTGSPRRFRSFLAELGPARRETAGFTPCAPRRTHPRRNPVPKRPSAFPPWGEPPIVWFMTPCLGGCALTYASAQGVLCAHAKKVSNTLHTAEEATTGQQRFIRSSSRRQALQQ